MCCFCIIYQWSLLKTALRTAQKKLICVYPERLQHVIILKETSWCCFLFYVQTMTVFLAVYCNFFVDESTNILVRAAVVLHPAGHNRMTGVGLRIIHFLCDTGDIDNSGWWFCVFFWFIVSFIRVWTTLNHWRSSA